MDWTVDLRNQIYEGIKDIPPIPELNDLHDIAFTVSTEDVLYTLIEDKQVIVVSGSFFGDEGKGKTVAALARHPDVVLIVRSNAGENAGHTVYHKGRVFFFHLAPSGLVVPGKTNAIGPNCVMDPVSFMETEIRQLVDNGISYRDTLVVGNVHIVTPYHKLLDALGLKNSSTLKGISPVHASKVTKRGLRLDDLFNEEDIQAERLRKDLEMYHALIQYRSLSEEQLLAFCEQLNEETRKRIPDHVVQFLREGDKVEYLLDLYRRHVRDNPKFPKRGDVTRLIQRTLEEGKKVLLEGAQSNPLSNNVETHWRSSTSADTTAAGTKAAAGYNTEKYQSITINIHKTPASSRVGIGANPAGYVPQDYFSSKGIESGKDLEGRCEDFDEIQRNFFEAIQANGIIIPNLYTDKDGTVLDISPAMAIASSKQHGEFGATTKKPRICGLFDCVVHHRVNAAQGPYLSISALDRGDEYDKVGLVIAYVVFDPTSDLVRDSQGNKYPNLHVIRPGDDLPCESVLAHCHPIVRVYDAWKDNPISVGKRNPDDPLPSQLQSFLAGIAHYTQAEIISIGNSPEDVIYVKQSR